MSYSYQPTRSKKHGKVSGGSALVILSRGAIAWYRSFPMEMTVGELRHKLAREIGRRFDGVGVGLDLFITGTDVAPSLLTRLSDLTYPPYQNVCLDVGGGPPSSQTSTTHSLGERLLRKHLCNERFQAGLAQRLWRLIQLRWPHAIFGISTRFGDGDIALRLNLEKYPTVPPVVEFWDLETQTALEPLRWPAHFVRFAITNYPELANLRADSYYPQLLHISTEIARRRKHATSPRWEVTQDLTQLLSRASCCFRSHKQRSEHQ